MKTLFLAAAAVLAIGAGAAHAESGEVFGNEQPTQVQPAKTVMQVSSAQAQTPATAGTLWNSSFAFGSG